MLYEQSERYRRLSVPLDQGHRDIAAERRVICDAAREGPKPAGNNSQRSVIGGLWALG